MYYLEEIDDFCNCEQIKALFSALPKKPYCANTKSFCYPRTKSHALQHVYIQPNTPFVVNCLVFDLDDSNALFAYHDNHAPRPHLIIKNPENGHAHYVYMLAVPVGLTGKSSQKAIDYLYAVYFALRERLGADKGYSGNLIKNPANKAWQSYTTGRIDPYTLDELAENLRLPNKAEIRQAKEQANDAYYGRNCAVFENTRHQAYRIAHKYSESLFDKIFDIALNENAKFNNPMLFNEVRHIAKSITRFCSSPRFIINQQKSSREFSMIQAERGSKGGKKSRRPSSQDSQEAIKPWEALGISRRTYYYWKKEGKLP